MSNNPVALNQQSWFPRHLGASSDLMKDVVFQSEISKQKLGKYLDCNLEALELKSMLSMWQLLQSAAYIETRPRNLVAAIQVPFRVYPSEVRWSNFSFPPLFHLAMVLFNPATVLRHPATVLHNPTTVLSSIVVQGCNLRWGWALWKQLCLGAPKSPKLKYWGFVWRI